MQLTFLCDAFRPSDKTKMTETQTKDQRPKPVTSEDSTEDEQRPNDIVSDDERSSSSNADLEVREVEDNSNDDKKLDHPPETSKKDRKIALLHRFFVSFFLQQDYPLSKELYNTDYISSILHIEIYDEEEKMATFQLSTKEPRLIDDLVKFYRDHQVLCSTGSWFSRCLIEQGTVVFTSTSQDVFNMWLEWEPDPVDQPPKKRARKSI